MKNRFLSIILIGIVVLVTLYSHFIFGFLLLLFFALFIILLAFALTLWFEGDLEHHFKKALQFSIPGTAIIYLTGYFYKTFSVLW